MTRISETRLVGRQTLRQPVVRYYGNADVLLAVLNSEIKKMQHVPVEQNPRSHVQQMSYHICVTSNGCQVQTGVLRRKTLIVTDVTTSGSGDCWLWPIEWHEQVATMQGIWWHMFISQNSVMEQYLTRNSFIKDNRHLHTIIARNVYMSHSFWLTTVVLQKQGIESVVQIIN